MPALISGRLVADAEPRGVDDLSLRLKDSAERVPWSAQPNVFARAREAGLNTAVVGWYHPYCRILHASLTQCSWQPYLSATESLPRAGGGTRLDLPRSLWGQIKRTASSALLVTPFDGAVAEERRRRETDGERKQHAFTYLQIRERALEAVTNPHVGFTLVHWPIPHTSRSHQNAADRPRAGEHEEYLLNLALSDHTLQELRVTMQRAGLWERTIVLISADHGLRNDEVWRRATHSTAIPGGRRPLPLVPFLLKLPGHDHASEYAPPFNTVLTHDLLLALLRGELSSQEQVMRWLDQNRARFPVG